MRFAAILSYLGLLIAVSGQSQGPGPGPWQREPPELHGFDPAALENAAREIQQGYPQRNCLVVIRNGVIVGEWYFQGDENSAYTSYSLTKTIGSSLIGIAVEEGLIDINEFMTTYVPDVAGEVVDRNALVRHFLSQCSTEPAGTSFFYENREVIDNLSRALAVATGERTADYAARSLAPLGMTNFTWPTNDELGNLPFGFGSTGSCRDYARMGQLWLNEGEWGGRQLASRNYIRQGRYPQYSDSNSAQGFLLWTNTDIPGKNWHIGDMTGEGSLDPTAPSTNFMALGAAGQDVIVSPEYNIVISTMGTSGAGDGGFSFVWNHIINSLVKR